MAITFRDDRTLGEGPFILVMRDGREFGKIFHRAGGYRFYVGDRAKLGGRRSPRRESRATRSRDPSAVCSMIAAIYRPTPRRSSPAADA